jgi:hypothetical protein
MALFSALSMAEARWRGEPVHGNFASILPCTQAISMPMQMLKPARDFAELAPAEIDSGT